MVYHLFFVSVLSYLYDIELFTYEVFKDTIKTKW